MTNAVSSNESGWLDLLRTVRQHWVLALVVGLLVTVAAGAYVMSLPRTYCAELVLAPSQDSAGPGASKFGGLASLASLAGVQLPGQTDISQTIAILKSRDLAAELIEERNFLPILFVKHWDPQRRVWVDVKDPFTISDGVKRFLGARKVIDDRRAGIVQLQVTWTDPQHAADWANELVRLVNEKTRDTAIAESNRLIAQLQAEAATAETVEIRSAIYQALETQVQSRALLRVRKDFALKILDSSGPADRNLRSGPKRLLLLAAGLMLGCVLGIAAATSWALLRKFSATAQPT